ncbi:acyltransferase family protein [Rhizosphaericola mali]|uniref:Acyltransferase n=1 Tax=Rhizosphaericola mali TaxID=2545455 RepID=A0A5P2GE20_9BACT|nr:acyltransferase [Rhizosphaericola mali]QES89851.1 acyltransferase [Rhizosphaericola mali]
MATKEIKALTGIRGLLALRVVFDHYFEYDLLKKMEKWQFPLKDFVVCMIERGYFTVDFFFLLSSFVLCLVYEKKFKYGLDISLYKNFMLKRIVRIYPFYLLNILLFSALLLPKLTLHKFIVNLFFIQSLYDIKHIINAATWSLSVEFIMYLIFPFLLVFFSRQKLWKTIIIVLIMTAGIYITSQYFDSLSIETINKIKRIPFKNNLGDSFGVNAVLRGVSGFMLGILTYQLYKNKTFLQKIQQFATPILVVTFLAFFVKWTVLFTPYLLALNILILCGDNWYAKINETKIVYTFGLLSFSIYLNHLLVRYSFTKFLYETALKYEQRMWLFSIETICTLMFSYFTYRLFEIPVNGFFRKKLQTWENGSAKRKLNNADLSAMDKHIAKVEKEKVD